MNIVLKTRYLPETWIKINMCLGLMKIIQMHLKSQQWKIQLIQCYWYMNVFKRRLVLEKKGNLFCLLLDTNCGRGERLREAIQTTGKFVETLKHNTNCRERWSIVTDWRLIHCLTEAGEQQFEQFCACSLMCRVVRRWVSKANPCLPDVLTAVYRLQVFCLVLNTNPPFLSAVYNTFQYII